MPRLRFSLRREIDFCRWRQSCAGKEFRAFLVFSAWQTDGYLL